MGQQNPAIQRLGELDREARHKLLDAFVMMPLAALLAYVGTTGTNVKVGDAQLDAVAQRLAQLITLYSISEDRQSVVVLGADDTQGGRFRMAGKLVEFPDGRPPITGLAVTRASLNGAIDELKRSSEL